ncbi:hypothetical protein ASPWEDRAFT_122132 [Aspergillus wentii DTO 134E9]|uniref:Allergen Asp f 4 n=1 Tax=Aspergillus wentii DTO 134E9 TaxID=1073089 RepID=A0A1L9R4K1_ASPWE|nr:uncharacterized protein ASPWEDRAFT_122132 [Aspergillus wentii DTO 134E9]KAI9927124.1 hypothetical protein MW887_003507 [Aspergillus wentii]OJJ29849.1 hypothetical protein ASPWEDRAFT_122132 [Aspergillus wentii DTO 134E9]
MQWKSLLLLAAAVSVEARLHGHVRRHAHHHENSNIEARDASGGVATEVQTSTALDVDVVMVTKTVTDYPAGGGAPTTTVQVVPATQTTDHAIPTTTSTHTSFHTSTSTRSEASAATKTHTTHTAAATKTSTASDSSNWTATPAGGSFSTAGFGKRTTASGTGNTYKGNVGSPWGSNIIEVSSAKAHNYKYVVKFTGSNKDPWTVVIWNKIGPDGKMDGWYGHSALNLTIEAGESKYVAFDVNSQGGWGAAKGTKLPTDNYGGYSCTWGEFDFGDSKNKAWSGWDVSAIQAQAASQDVQGMRICESSGSRCSYITTGAEKVVNAYTKDMAAIDGIGGKVNTDAVRLAVHVDFNE